MLILVLKQLKSAKKAKNVWPSAEVFLVLKTTELKDIEVQKIRPLAENVVNVS